MSWKTTLLGVASALAGLCTLVAAPYLDADVTTVPDWTAFGAVLLAAIGLVMAKDNKKE
jgi:hypothetical protein